MHVLIRLLILDELLIECTKNCQSNANPVFKTSLPKPPVLEALFKSPLLHYASKVSHVICIVGRSIPNDNRPDKLNSTLHTQFAFNGPFLLNSTAELELTELSKHPGGKL